MKRSTGEMLIKEADESTDELRDFDLKIAQPKNGYRFSLDPLLLCDFAGKNCSSLLDLGTGCGIIPLVMARRCAADAIVGIELQPLLAAVARRNITANGLADRVTVIESDILDLGRHFKADSFDLVMGNPPYRRAGTGKTSPRAGRDLARHESSATMADFLAMAKKLVKPSGHVCLIYHPERLPELLLLAQQLKLSPARLQMVHGDGSLPARMFMVELIKGRKTALEILPPVMVKNSVYGAHQQGGQ